MTSFHFTIDILTRTPSKHLPPFPPLQQLDHFSLWYTRINKRWMMQLGDIINKNQKRIIKTLEFEINDKRLIVDDGDNDGGGNSGSITKRPSSPIYLKTIGPTISLPSTIHNLYDDNSVTYRKNILIIPPLLNHLTQLDINAGDYCTFIYIYIYNISI
ncbi:hypothetical protein BJ944DRAFT_265108 [Cunninghamella echinulata]|nr:hypothetical protein BJ944DRAFT_265108 [Cunninghamella echinulata]